MGFAWRDQQFVYTSCPFGISSGGLVFSKILRELVKRWRSMGISMVLYLDDGIIIGSSHLEVAEASRIIRQDLQNAGFIINEKKSRWEPCQHITWLGFILNAQDNLFEVPAEKMERIRIGISKNLYYKQHCGPRELAKTVGRLTSLYHALGSVVFVLTKDCSHWIASRENWNHCLPLSDGAIQELEFWQRNLSVVIRRPLAPDLYRDTLIVYSDASATGCGAFVLGDLNTAMVHYWSRDEQKASSTWRELQAVVLFIEIHHEQFSGRALMRYTDNQGVPRVVFKGSMVPQLNLGAFFFFFF
jgi:hypothetical protein